MCLLLTLLAVPVFYSLFDDAKELTIFRSISNGMSNLISHIRRPKQTDGSEETEQFEGHEAG